MNRSVIGIIALISFLVGPGIAALASDESEIRQVFDEFQSALSHMDGGVAAELLSADSISYFESLRDLALFGTRDEIIARPADDILQVLQIRRDIDPNLLREMSGRDLAAYYVEHGWLSLDSSVRLIAGSTSVDRDKASTGFTVSEASRPGRLTFVREGDSWKFDIMPFILAGRERFEDLVELMHLRGEDRVNYVIDMVFPKNFDWHVWLPPFQRP